MPDTPELDTAHEREQREYLAGLLGINSKLEPHVRHLAQLRQAREGSGILMSGGAATLVEDEDDFRIVSMRPREEMDRLLSQLRRQLDFSQQLGLADHPYVKAFELRYFASDPGISQ